MPFDPHILLSPAPAPVSAFAESTGASRGGGQEAMGATLIGLWFWSQPIQPNVVKVQCTTGTNAVNPNSQLRDILQVRAN